MQITIYVLVFDEMKVSLLASGYRKVVSPPASSFDLKPGGCLPHTADIVATAPLHFITVYKGLMSNVVVFVFIVRHIPSRNGLI